MNMLSCLKKNFKIVTLFCFLLIIGLGGYYGYNWQIAQDTSALTVAPDQVCGKIIILRKLKERYFIDYHNMFSRDVRQGFEWPENIDLDYTIRFLKHDMELDKLGKRLAYCVFDAKENRLIGEVHIHEIDKYGQFSCWINERYRGGGRIQEAIKLLTNVYFRLTDEEYFVAHVRAWNKPSYKALIKSGFIDKGKFLYEDGFAPRHVLEFHRKK